MTTDRQCDYAAEEDVETFFGCTRRRSRCVSGAGGQRIDRRPLRRGVWSKNNDDVSWADAMVQHFTKRIVPLLDDDGECDETMPRIPRIFHFIWLGPGDPPSFPSLRIDGVGASAAAEGAGGFDMSKLTRTADDVVVTDNNEPGRRQQRRKRRWNEPMRSWLRHHSTADGWSFRIWTDDDLPSPVSSASSSPPPLPTLYNRAAFDYAVSQRNYGMASDVLRLEILHRYGGVYVDVDYWCTAPLTDLHDRLDWYCGASNTGVVSELNNGLIGSTPGHGLIDEMRRRIQSWFEGQRRSILEEVTPPKPKPPPSMLLSFLDGESAAALREATTKAEVKGNNHGEGETLSNTGPGLVTRTLGGILARRYVTRGGGRGLGAGIGLDGDDDGEPEAEVEAEAEAEATKSDDDSLPGCDLDRVAVLPADYFHPFPNQLRGELSLLPRKSTTGGEIDRDTDEEGDDGSGGEASSALSILDDFIVPGRTRAIHLWGCSWQKKASIATEDRDVQT